MGKKKINPAVLDSYVVGVPHVKKFMEKEIGSEATYQEVSKKAAVEYKEEYARIVAEETKKLKRGEVLEDKVADAVEKSTKAQKLNARLAAVKAGHHRLYSQLKKYGEEMENLFASSDIVDKKKLENLINTTYSLKTGNILSSRNASWNNEAGAKAMNKFTNILLNNDLKKFQYYHNCLDKSNFKGLTLNEVLNRPLPMVRQPDAADREALKNKVLEWGNNLKKADTKLHRNSAEFKAMKASIKAVGEAILQKKSDAELGKCLEVMQAASMRYVKAKGVGMQSSTMGKDRMSTALDICGTATEYMDCYASEERIQEINRFEKDDVKKVMSENGVFNYDISLEKDDSLSLKPFEDEMAENIL